MSEDDCKKLWGRHRPATVCFSTAEADQALAILADAKARKKAAEEDEKAAKLAVMAVMQDNEVLKSADGTKVLATWKNAKDSAKTDWEAVAREVMATWPGEAEAVIAKHTTVTAGSRRFLPKE